MTEPLSKDLFPFLGRPIRNECDREIGKIVSFIVSPNGHIDAVLVNHADGEFVYYPTKQLNITKDSIVLLADATLRANALCEEIPLVWRKDQILNSLLKEEKILPEIYESLHREFDATLSKLKANAQDVIAEIDKQIANCDEKFKKLHSAKIHLKIESEIGEIDEESYGKSIEIILDGLKSVVAEKNDLETLRARLSSLLLDEGPPGIEETEPVEPVTEDTVETMAEEAVEPVAEEAVEPIAEEIEETEETVEPVTEETVSSQEASTESLDEEQTEFTEETVTPPSEPSITVRLK